jgi:hypothetical protein
MTDLDEFFDAQKARADFRLERLWKGKKKPQPGEWIAQYGCRKSHKVRDELVQYRWWGIKVRDPHLGASLIFRSWCGVEFGRHDESRGKLEQCKSCVKNSKHHDE